jgi:hypothetical protein
MAVLVESFFDEPIVIFKFAGRLNHDTLREANSQAAELLNRMGMYFAILDFRALHNPEVASADTLKFVLPLMRDPRVHPVLVASSETLSAALPCFENSEQALAYVREQIAHRAHHWP